MNPDDYMPGQILDCELTFNCPQKWGELQPTESHRVRFCPECEMKVVFCSTPRQVEKAKAKKQCLAFWGGVGDPTTGIVTMHLGYFERPGAADVSTR